MLLAPLHGCTSLSRNSGIHRFASLLSAKQAADSPCWEGPCYFSCLTLKIYQCASDISCFFSPGGVHRTVGFLLERVSPQLHFLRCPFLRVFPAKLMRKQQCDGGEQCGEQCPLWLTRGGISKLQHEVSLFSLATRLHTVGTQHLQSHQQRGHSEVRETTEAMPRTEA